MVSVIVKMEFLNMYAIIALSLFMEMNVKMLTIKLVGSTKIESKFQLFLS